MGQERLTSAWELCLANDFSAEPLQTSCIGVRVVDGRVEQLKGDSFFDQNTDVFINRELESYSLSQHTHDFVEISIVGEGCGYHYIEDQVMPVKQGDLFLIPIGTSHVFRPSSPGQDKQLVTYNCIFRSRVLDDWKHYFCEESETSKIIYGQNGCSIKWLQFQDKHNTFLAMFHSMHWEYMKRQRGYEILMKTLLIQMLAMLQRFEANREVVPVSNDKFEDVVHFIKSHYYENITVQYVADYFFMSASHFQRLFKKSTGLTFTQYLQNVRIQKCCELLKSTDIPIHEIANRVGYQDMKFFHSLFRKKTGVTPRHYRQNFQESEEDIVMCY